MASVTMEFVAPRFLGFSAKTIVFSEVERGEIRKGVLSWFARRVGWVSVVGLSLFVLLRTVSRIDFALKGVPRTHQNVSSLRRESIRSYITGNLSVIATAPSFVLLYGITAWRCSS